MEIAGLLDAVRHAYINELSAAAHEGEYHIEPVLRLSDGRAGCEGKLKIPCRYDLVRKDTGEVHSIDTARRIELAPLRLALNGKLLDITAFSWDWLTLDIVGIAEDDATRLMRDWFMRWFDEEDVNSPDAEGLYGVVHFLSDAKPIDGGLCFHIDLGSVSAGAVAELVEILLNQGASTLALRGD